jgi:hypothetical protein
LQTPRPLRAPASKCLTAQVKAALTSPSLQTSQRAAGALVGASGNACGCPRSTAGASTDTRANNRHGLAPTRAAPVPGSRDNRHRFVAWPFASVAVVRADRLQHRNIVVGELAVAAEMPRRRPHTAASPCTLLRPANPSEVLAWRLRLERHAPDEDGIIVTTAASTTVARQKREQSLSHKIRSAHQSIQRVNSAEHTWVKSRERQGTRR